MDAHYDAALHRRVRAVVELDVGDGGRLRRRAVRAYVWTWRGEGDEDADESWAADGVGGRGWRLEDYVYGRLGGEPEHPVSSEQQQ